MQRGREYRLLGGGLQSECFSSFIMSLMWNLKFRSQSRITQGLKTRNLNHFKCAETVCFKRLHPSIHTSRSFYACKNNGSQFFFVLIHSNGSESSSGKFARTLKRL